MFVNFDFHLLALELSGEHRKLPKNHFAENENWLIQYGYHRNYAVQNLYKHCIMPILVKTIDIQKPLEEQFCCW